METGIALREQLIGFCRQARDYGFSTGLAESRDWLAVAAQGELGDRSAMMCAARALFCVTPQQWAAFPAFFSAYWDRQHELESKTEQATTRASATPRGGNAGEAGISFQDQRRRFAGLGGSSSQSAGAGAGDYEILSKADFRFISDAQQREMVAQGVERIARQIRKRQLRRIRGNLIRGRKMDLGRTMRRALGSDGWPFQLRYRQRVRDLPRLILLLDISQSMEVYSQLFIRFAWAFSCRHRDVHTFAFHVRLLDLRREMKERHPERLQQQLDRYGSIWLGGTRVAGSIAEFNQRYSGHLVNRRSVVVVVSDGCDSEGSDRLPQEMALLARRAGSVVWLNPLLGRGGQSDVVPPLERGLHDSLAHIDYYGPAHSLESLRALEQFLARH